MMALMSSWGLGILNFKVGISGLKVKCSKHLRLGAMNLELR